MSALLLTFVLSAAAGGPRFIEDDFAKAQALAKKEGKLLFVDAWAPWCHTCVFMREHVLGSPELTAYESKLVFASIDTEKTKSEPFLAKFPVDVWPTLFIIDPSTSKVRFVWSGSADLTQLKALLDAAQGSLGDSALAQADQLAASGDLDSATQRYLDARPTDPRGVASMLAALYRAKRYEVCASTTAELAPNISRAQDKVTALGWGLSCALALDKANDARKAALPKLTQLAMPALELTGVLVDDLSSLYESLVQERLEAGDKLGANALATHWLQLLERSAAAATTPGQRAAFDAHRVGAALAIERPERVVDALLLSELQFPKDFNPPARLARIYQALGRAPEALAAIDRALAKNGEGPRRVCLLRTKADLQKGGGDVGGARTTVTQGLAYAKRLPNSPLKARCLKGLEVLDEPSR